jgi:cobalamin biosynthesis protein CobD/CbiB
METEISAELKEELRFIEKETRLLSQAPQSMRAFSVILWCVFAAVLIAVVLALKNGNYLSVLFFLVLGGFLVGTYFHQKKLFNMYSTACEIINYYKLKETSKTKPPFDSNPSPEGIIP